MTNEIRQSEMIKRIIDSEIIRRFYFTPTEGWLLIVFACYYPEKLPSLDYVAKKIGLTLHSLKGAIRKLRGIGILNVETIWQKKKRIDTYSFAETFIKAINGSNSTTPSPEDNNKEDSK